MLNKFWNYQRILGASTDFNNSKKSSKVHLFIYMVFIFTFSLTLGEGGIVFYQIIFTLYVAYSIINSQKKIFEIPPVSKIYSLINIYLLIFVMNLATTVGGTIGIIVVKLLEQLTYSLNADAVEFINLLINNWKGILIVSCITIIIESILLPIFFIRLNALRKTLIISLITLALVVLRSIRTTLPVLTEFGEIIFSESSKINTEYDEILLILICVCVVTIPISILISYRLYKGKRC